MREKPRDIERLRHILSCINVLLENRARYSLEELQQNQILFFGFVKEVEIIGEAAYKLTFDFRRSHSDVAWDDIVAMRQVLVHGYYLISPTKVWETVNKDLEPLKPYIEAYIRELEQE